MYVPLGMNCLLQLKMWISGLHFLVFCICLYPPMRTLMLDSKVPPDFLAPIGLSVSGARSYWLTFMMMTFDHYMTAV